VEIHCHHCGQVFQVTGDIFVTNRERAELECPACKGSLQVVNPKLATFRAERTNKKVSSITSAVTDDGRFLHLPEDKEISLKVLEGEEKGTVYPVAKARVTIGRANADITVNDGMVSRVHCALEISEDGILLRDLESTNGTLVDDQLIQTATLSHGSTFRIGTHLFQLLITSKES
jgi:pSer/pThr/pTyr-binding forkhead associated (FHA) protein